MSPLNLIFCGGAFRRSNPSAFEKTYSMCSHTHIYGELNHISRSSLICQIGNCLESDLFKRFIKEDSPYGWINSLWLFKSFVWAESRVELTVLRHLEFQFHKNWTMKLYSIFITWIASKPEARFYISCSKACALHMHYSEHKSCTHITMHKTNRFTILKLFYTFNSIKWFRTFIYSG